MSEQLDKNSPHYIHNLFLSLASVWHDNSDEWVMTEDEFKDALSQLNEPQKQQTDTEDNDLVIEVDNWMKSDSTSIWDLVKTLKEKYSISKK